MIKLLALISILFVVNSQINTKEQLFTEFTRVYNKLFHGERDLKHSLKHFEENLEKINIQTDRYSEYGITQFSDLSPEEFEQQYLNDHFDDIEKNSEFLGEKRNLSFLEYLFGVDISHLPKNFDWREKGIITEPKEQGTCGSCWAFITTSILEAQYAKKHNKKLDFSEQFLLDCDDLDFGCTGGLMTNAFKYTHKIQTTEQYGAYQDRENTCHADPNLGVTKDENSIMKELYENGPVAVGVNGRYLQFYRKGIHDPGDKCDDQINHAVLIVGYGVSEDGIPYWILKNQWGQKWGENGYYRMVRGKNMCGVTRYATIAFVE